MLDNLFDRVPVPFLFALCTAFAFTLFYITAAYIKELEKRLKEHIMNSTTADQPKRPLAPGSQANIDKP